MLKSHTKFKMQAIYSNIVVLYKNNSFLVIGSLRAALNYKVIFYLKPLPQISFFVVALVDVVAILALH